MSIVEPILSDQRFFLQGVPWRTYLELRESRENLHIRMTYNRGQLEMMAPSKMSAFHVRLGGGWVDNWESTYEYSYDTGGLGWEIGAGYDMKVGRRFYLTPFVAYSVGKIGDMNMDQSALTGGLGFVWR